MDESIDISIAIVTYNNSNVIKKCLDSIFETIKNLKFELIIVDNSSSDDTIEIIENNFKNIKLIQNNKNIGFSAAHNIAIKSRKGKYHLVLNPDIIFTENSIKKLVNFIEENLDVWIVFPKIIYPDETT